jgi:hypothetical protein
VGRERDCAAIIHSRDGEKRVLGRALLETDEIIFRSKGDKPHKVKLTAGARAVEGKLHVGDLVLVLGDDADNWAHAINHPKGRLEKLGVKPGQRVGVVDLADEAFLAELRVIVPELEDSKLDVLFFAAEDKSSLARLPALKKKLAPAGALWIVRPKGVKTITESDVMSAGKQAGLVDVKVARFSDTHTAEKFVIPVAKR